jgi:MFS family permease
MPILTFQPTLCVMYFLNYVDRNTIAQARLNGLEDDLGMSGVEFNTAVSILFVGYVLMQVPSNMLITRLKPAAYMSSWMVIWAVVSGCTGAVQNYAGLVACRFFLGITESPFYPGAIYVLSIWYTRREVAARVAVLYSAQILATGFTGLIAAGVFAGLDGTQGLAGWRWLFILEGIFTFAIGIMGFWLLPNTPLDTRWLSAEERELAHSRMEMDRVESSPQDVTSFDGLKQAVRDPRAWLFSFMQMFHLSGAYSRQNTPRVLLTPTQHAPSTPFSPRSSRPSVTTRP